VLGVGVAFKPGVDDLRESPSLLVLDRLARRGADVSYHDSFVPGCEIDGANRVSMPLDADTVARQDIVVLLTPHPDVDVHALVNTASLVFDARGVTVGIDAANVVRL
jgi:UDP-N-acetyl-D-glucosamine dehydrogenase